MKGFVVAFSLLSMVVSGCRTSARPDVATRLDVLFADLEARGLFSGAVVVGRGREIVWEKGIGLANADRGVAFTPDTPADGGSLAKTFTAALLIMLQREGKLDLDAPAARLLPELPYSEITLRHLLTHSSGLPVYDYDYFDRHLPRDQVRTTELLLKVIAAEKPDLFFRPGQQFEYSSFGFDLAALAAERSAQQPLARLLERRFFEPLGFTSAFLRPGNLSEFPGIRTLGYRKVDGKLQIHDVFDLEAFHGGSNIYLSARDLHRWNASFQDRSWIEARGLAPVLDDVIIGRGLSGLTLGSWYRNTEGTAFSYAGHLQGFHAEVFRDLPSSLSVVYVSNNTLSPWLQHEIVRAVRSIAEGQDVEPLVEPVVDEIGEEERPRLAGRWVMSHGDPVTIEHVEGRTSMVRNEVPYRMVQVAPKYFYVPGLDFMIGFKKDSDGHPASMNVSSNFEEQWGRRVSH
jgi:CubicO group peptidase (beta-lactamase class C family)